jgi:hypothetical protein
VVCWLIHYGPTLRTACTGVLRSLADGTTIIAGQTDKRTRYKLFFQGNVATENKHSVTLVRERTILNERPALVGEVIANFRVVSAADPYGRNADF